MPGQSGQPVRLDSILGPDGCECDERGSVGGAPIGSGCQPALSDLGRGSCDASVLIVVIRGPSGSGQTSMLRTLCEHCAHLPYWLEQIWATSGNLTVDLATADFIVPSQFDPGSAPPTGAPRQR